jgi:alpha-tubulin suppressor-like RCC1 family protein
MQWSHASTGQGHTLALASGALYGTGRNSSNELGLGSPIPGQLRAMTPVDSGYSAVVAGQNSSCALRSDASVACWGDNGFGELGTGDMNPRASPTTSATDQRDVDVDTFHSCALSAAHTISCSGRNVEGQLGTGNQVDQTSLTPSGTFDDWILLSIGRFHSCGMRSDHSVWCVGQNTMGQLGIGMSPNRFDWVRAL